jgi:hypothetical protein
MRTRWSRSPAPSGCASNIGTIAPSRYTTVAPLARIDGQKPEAEKRDSNTTCAPVSAACAKVLSALMWNSGSVVHSTSSAATPSTSALFTPHQKYCACGQITPLAGPVVPEV